MNNNEIENKTDLIITKTLTNTTNKENKTFINILIDDMGFSRYHFLIFSITALVLTCCGVQELMMAIILSMINEKENLSEYHLAIITTSEYIGYTTAAIVVNFV